jgi:hypothetical protein
MTVIVNEVFNVIDYNYVLLNMSEYEKCYYIWKYFNNISVKTKKSPLSLLIQFQYNVLFEYAIYLFGETVIEYENLFDELKQSFHGEIVKQLMVKKNNINDAIPMIHLCLTLLREIQDTKNENNIMYYLIKNENTIILITK